MKMKKYEIPKGDGYTVYVTTDNTNGMFWKQYLVIPY